jgi:hypothetical protein
MSDLFTLLLYAAQATRPSRFLHCTNIGSLPWCQMHHRASPAIYTRNQLGVESTFGATNRLIF